MSDYTTPPPPPKSSGKKWALFGCGGCLGLLVIGALAIGAFLYFGMQAFKQMPVYKEALAAAQNSPEVQEALGTPITDSLIGFSGSSTTTNGVAGFQFNVPLSGPKGKGTLSINASQSGQDIVFDKLEVKVDASGKVIQLPVTTLPGITSPADTEVQSAPPTEVQPAPPTEVQSAPQ